MTEIVIQGIGGRMGHVLCDMIAQREDCCVVAGIDVKDGEQNGIPVYDSPEKLTEFIGTVTGGDGFDATVEAVGAPATFLACVKAVASRGKMVVIGVAKKNADFNFLEVQRKELNMYGSRGATSDDFRAVLKLVREGFVDLTKLISRTYSADHAEEAFEDLDKNYGEIVKAEFEF